MDASATSTSALVDPARVYPPRGGRPAFRLIDVRAPVEVARGSLPAALNIPILDDEERRQVGIRYKEAGQEEAVKLGFDITAAQMPSRVAAWRDACASEPTAIACWRGGMRSRLAQQFIGRQGVPRVRGGYKALRAHLLEGLRKSLEVKRVLVLTGMTGTGKTELIESLGSHERLLALDLEGLANHRGSTYGTIGAQPPQQSFENDLAARVLLSPADAMVVEDESRRIGSLHLPDEVYSRIAASSVLVLEATRQERVERIHREYVLAPVERLGPERALADLAQATERLRRRLGGELTNRLLAVLEDAGREESWREVEAMNAFIAPLLEEYYDPLYRRATGRMEREVVVRGSGEELREWLRRNV